MTRWSDYVAQLTWERLGILPEELEEVSGEMEVCSGSCPPRPGCGWMDGYSVAFQSLWTQKAETGDRACNLEKVYFRGVAEAIGRCEGHAGWDV